MPNETGQRVCERDIGRAFGAYSASAHTSNKGKPLFDPPRAQTLAQRCGWSVDPASRGSADSPACIEVYPHPAMVGLFGLGQRILYKKGPDRRQGFVELMGHLETIPELRVTAHPRWRELRRIVATPGRGDLNRIEDEIDAVFCADLAWLWHHQPGRLQVYGSLAEGYIVAPPPPTHAAAKPITAAKAIAGHTEEALEAVTFDVVSTPVTSATAGEPA